MKRIAYVCIHIFTLPDVDRQKSQIIDKPTDSRLSTPTDCCIRSHSDFLRPFESVGECQKKQKSRGCPSLARVTLLDARRLGGGGLGGGGGEGGKGALGVGLGELDARGAAPRAEFTRSSPRTDNSKNGEPTLHKNTATFLQSRHPSHLPTELSQSSGD